MDGDRSTATELADSLIDQRASTPDWLVGGGEMAKAIGAIDWSTTPLGPIHAWPQSLRTTVSLCLASNFPISIAWGPHHTQIYNDGYWPICGAKHPHSMGQDFTECWASAWPVIGEAFARALEGQTSYLENQRMFLDRNGYLEETFFTFSFSPIRDETNAVGGLFHPVTETTPTMIGERRTQVLRDLAARTSKAQSTNEALTLAAQTFGSHPLDLPFVRFYTVAEDGVTAQLEASSNLDQEAMMQPAFQLGSPQDLWGLDEAVPAAATVIRSAIAPLLQSAERGPYDEPPSRACLIPIFLPRAERPIAILVAGISARLPMSDAYRAFYDFLASGVAIALTGARAYEEERKRARALAELDLAKTTFFSNISHEFRTPLTLMLGPLEEELAQVTTHSEESRVRLETTYRNSLRLLKLVNTLLDFSRIEAGRVQATYEPTDLSRLTADLASVFRSAIEKAGLTLTVDCAPLTEPVYVDTDMWEKIVLNLLSNALKHTFEGHIHVTLSAEDGAAGGALGKGIVLRVADSGIGIPATELTRLFDRFHRITGARSRSHEGTGIGLALVQELAGLHQGSVTVESTEGVGTTFIVSLKSGSAHLPAEATRHTPRATALASDRVTAYVEEALQWVPTHDTGHTSSSNADSGTATATSPRATGRIVWADDNADLRAYVTSLLKPHYDVEAVADGRDALEAIRLRPPDLVLSDVMMPNLDGFGLLRELRADPATRELPVILLSARAGQESSIEGLQAGADDYLVKPFSARELLARVRTHFELARVRRAAAIELERANKELEAFSYSVSHDLRAPLRAIDGFLRLVVERHAPGISDEGLRYLTRVREASLRMGELIDDLLNLSRLGRSPMRQESVDLSALSASILATLALQDPERQVDVRVDPGLRLHADPRLLGVVLENLLGNAWKFTGRTPAARIEVGADVQEDGTQAIYIRDNGAGFEMEYANKLFLPFQRLHRPSDFEGTGIGLATVQRVIERHSGRVWAEAAPGAGATFFFTVGEVA